MSKKTGKCTSCGELIEVNDEKELGICKFCGEPFSVKKVISNFNCYFNHDTE